MNDERLTASDLLLKKFGDLVDEVTESREKIKQQEQRIIQLETLLISEGYPLPAYE